MSEPTQAVKPAPPANRNGLLIALVAVNMLGMAGLGVYLAMSARAGAQAPTEAAGPEEEVDPLSQEMGPLVEFESMIVNLDESSTDRYLKLTFQLELSSEEVAPEAAARMVPFRDATLMYLTSLGIEQVSGPEHALEVREHLLELARQTMGVRTVRHIYFTEYLVQ